MGDRVSIQFEKNGKKSVALFSHWGGMDFVANAQNYTDVLKAERNGKHMMPLDRLEPETVMVDFIRYITKDEERIESGLYLGVDDNDGDNSDNGNHIIKLD